jgi:hypothetical protein
MTRRLELMMGWLFAIGSTCFALGSLPLYFNRVEGSVVAATFFAGSLFFTSAAYIQYHLSINKDGVERRYFRGEWNDPDVVASGIQLIGTVFFNISTLAATLVDLSVQQEDRLIWAPDVFGSIAFLVSSVIAFRYVRRQAGRRPTEHGQDWWNAFTGLLGSVAFGISAVAAVVLPTTGEPLNISIVNATTFVGAAFFLAGAIVSLGVDDAPTGSSAG